MASREQPAPPPLPAFFGRAAAPASQVIPPWSPDRAEKDGIGALAALERFRFERHAVGVDGRPTYEFVLVPQGDAGPGRGDVQHPARGLRNFGADAVTGQHHDASRAPGANGGTYS